MTQVWGKQEGEQSVSQGGVWLSGQRNWDCGRVVVGWGRTPLKFRGLLEAEPAPHGFFVPLQLGSPAGKAGAMALIEGVGDEVTILFAVLACLLVLALAWVSTHTAEGVDPLSQPSGTPPSTQPSEAMAVTDSIRGEAPGAETPSLRHRGQAAQPESGMGLPATPPPQDSPQEPLVLRLKFLNDSEQVARAWPHDTIGSLKR